MSVRLTRVLYSESWMQSEGAPGRYPWFLGTRTIPPTPRRQTLIFPCIQDNLKAPIELVKFRAQYYKFVITELLKSVVGQAGVDKLEFVLGSSYVWHEDDGKTCAY